MVKEILEDIFKSYFKESIKIFEFTGPSAVVSCRYFISVSAVSYRGFSWFAFSPWSFLGILGPGDIVYRYF